MSVPVREMVALRSSLKLKLVAGAGGLSRVIEAPRVQKPALALAGYLDQLHPGRVQVLGNAEVGYIERLPAPQAARAVTAVCRAPVACFVVTNGNAPPEVLRRAAARYRVPLFTTEQRTSAAIRAIARWLEERFAPETLVHGVLVEVLGLGVLLLGKSGVGKSEAALALLSRGHRLVADDVVRIREAPPGVIKGRCAEGLRQHLEIRGMGVLNVADLFGTLATLEEARVDLMIELLEQHEDVKLERLGLEDRHATLLGVEIPYLQIQLRAGRDVATIIEVATRNQILKMRGIHGARRFVASVDRNVRRAAQRGQA
ncbi:MAG: HPr(Ser) kinase/phosphatase [Thermodesulfobacteriota bacterium]